MNMNKIPWKSWLPYVVAVVLFITIAAVYFSPVLEGKKLDQHDIAMFKGMSKEIADFRSATGEEPLWTNSMFGGMPAWQISVQYSGNLIRYVDKLLMLGLPYPLNFVFLYFLGFYILLLVLKVDKRLSIVGAVAFALSSYFFVILGAGHTSKAHAIGYMAPVLAGIIMAFNGKYWKGALLTAVALALEIKAGHLQITYYLLLMVVVYGIFRLVDAVMQKTMPSFWKATGVLILAAVLAVLTHSTNLWATYQYGKDTMRGKPELNTEATVKSNGLDRDYITHWSYGIEETWSFLIPNAKGGASGLLGNVSELKEADAPYRSMLAQQTNAYWGDQPGTSGPVYMGAIIIFLFVLGLFVVKGRLKWALLTMTVLSVLLAWGHNLMWFTNIFIDYIPGYNKFRAVTMTLVIAELTVPLLGILALNELLKNPGQYGKSPSPVYWSMGITLGILAAFYLIPDTFFGFLSDRETEQFGQMMTGAQASQVTDYIQNLEAVRMAIFRADVLRSMLFIALAAGLVIVFLRQKISSLWLTVVLGLLILVDMFAVNKRYLNDDNFVRAAKVDVPFQPSKANQFILKDTDPDYRVLDITQSTFNDASTSYFHKSIGGYHGAKLQRYQDVIDHYLLDEIQSIVGVLSGQPTYDKVMAMFSHLPVLNMLNTRYVIFNPDAQPLMNTEAFGEAWFVDSLVVVPDADEEIRALNHVDLKKVAVVDQRFADVLPSESGDGNGAVRLTSYAPNELIYATSAAADQVAVFSEIYFANGWNSYLDGEKVPHFRANYLLRSMVVPAGEHQITFRFEPKIWSVGEWISMLSSALLILLLLLGIAYQARKWMAEEDKSGN